MIDLRPLPEFPGYLAGDDGFIYRQIKGRRYASYPLKRVGMTKGAYGYYKFVFKNRQTSVHTIIATAFHGPKPSWAHQVRHLNGNKRDNRPSNLQWGTYAENEADKRLHGTSNAGTRNGRAILNEKTVRELRALRRTGATYQALADRYGISNSNARYVAQGKSWVHI